MQISNSVALTSAGAFMRKSKGLAAAVDYISHTHSGLIDLPVRSSDCSRYLHDSFTFCSRYLHFGQRSPSKMAANFEAPS